MSMNRGQHEGHLPCEGAGCPQAGRTRPDLASARDTFELSEKKPPAHGNGTHNVTPSLAPCDDPAQSHRKEPLQADGLSLTPGQFSVALTP